MVTSDFRPEVEIWPFRAYAIKVCNIDLIYGRIAEIFASHVTTSETKILISFKSFKSFLAFVETL